MLLMGLLSLNCYLLAVVSYQVGNTSALVGTVLLAIACASIAGDKLAKKEYIS